MKEKVLAGAVHAKEAVFVSGGASAPIWMQSMNNWTGWLIGLFTLVYVIARALDFIYDKWINNWSIRKDKKQAWQEFLKTRDGK